MSSWDDPVEAGDGTRDLFADAARLAVQLTSSPAIPHEVSILLLNAERLVCVAASDATSEVRSKPPVLAEHPAYAGAIESGRVVAGPLGTAVPVHAHGAVVGLMLVHGATALDELQTEMLVTLACIVGTGVTYRSTVTELRLEAERSRRLERLKSEFLNIAAHELRSPLGIIRGYASMLSEGILAETDRAGALARVAEKSEEMARLISEMLETARLETSGLELELEPVDLTGIIDDAMHATQPMMGANHRFVRDRTSETVAVVADRRRLKTMLTNLIDNAIKYSPAGGDIELRCEHDGRVARVLIRDHGIGINTEQARRLFTRFGRLVTPETSHIRGTGLGLYLARETARLHGGDITVTSVPGRGSTFTVVLPVA